jgi:hypothetical protein
MTTMIMIDQHHHQQQQQQQPASSSEFHHHDHTLDPAFGLDDDRITSDLEKPLDLEKVLCGFIFPGGDNGDNDNDNDDSAKNDVVILDSKDPPLDHNSGKVYPDENHHQSLEKELCDGLMSLIKANDVGDDDDDPQKKQKTKHNESSMSPGATLDAQNITLGVNDNHNASKMHLVDDDEESEVDDDDDDDDEYTKEKTAPEIYEVDAAKLDAEIAKQFNSLSLQQRDKVLYDIHGVADVVNESPDLLQQSVGELELWLQKKKQRSSRKAAAYCLAESQSPHYVQSFGLKFLRAKQFDTKEAGLSMLRHFSIKREFFGDAKLTKDIALKDLNKDDMVCLDNGHFQILPVRDPAGRYIAVVILPHARFKEASNLVRTLLSSYGFVKGCICYTVVFLQRALTIYFVSPYAFIGPCRLVHSYGYCGRFQQGSHGQGDCFDFLQCSLPTGVGQECAVDDTTRPYCLALSGEFPAPL